MLDQFSHSIRRAGIAVLLSTTIATTLGLPAHAASFNPNHIISDSEMRDYTSMSFMDIYTFLGQQGVLNNHFDIDPIDGMIKGTAQLVHDAALRYRINPKYLLALMQKESSVVTSKSPTQRQLDWATGYALCDGCLRTNDLAQKYQGFAKQIDAGAGSMDWYMTNANRLTYKVGETTTISGDPVTPQNLATVGLYSYTPHLHGNRLLWTVWQRWFDVPEGASVGIRFPDGTLIRNAETGAVGLVRNGAFHPITNRSVLETRFARIVPVDVGPYEFRAVETANPGRPLTLPDLALVRTEDGSMYLLVGNTKRLIASPEVSARIGFNPEEIEDILTEDIVDYAPGAAITMNSVFPLGQLLQDSSTGGVYFVQDGVKYPIWDKAILNIRFPNATIIPRSPTDLALYPNGSPLMIPDGTLVKTPDNPTVYVISDGRKRAIPTEDVFLGYGYQWTSIVTVGDRMLALHIDGPPLFLTDGGLVEATLIP